MGTFYNIEEPDLEDPPPGQAPHYHVRLTPRQMEVVLRGCDLLSRVQMGQMEDVYREAIRAIDLQPLAEGETKEERFQRIDSLRNILWAIAPMVTGLPRGTSPGIASPVVPEDARIAADVMQALERRLSRDRQGAGMSIVSRCRLEFWRCSMEETPPTVIPLYPAPVAARLAIRRRKMPSPEDVEARSRARPLLPFPGDDDFIDDPNEAIDAEEEVVPNEQPNVARTVGVASNSAGFPAEGATAPADAREDALSPHAPRPHGARRKKRSSAVGV